MSKRGRKRKDRRGADVDVVRCRGLRLQRRGVLSELGDDQRGRVDEHRGALQKHHHCAETHHCGHGSMRSFGPIRGGVVVGFHITAV